MNVTNRKIVNIGTHCQYEFKQSSIMSMREEFTIMTEDGNVSLEVTISADFEGIPEKHRELFINMLTSKYMNVVSISNNIYINKKEIKNYNIFERIVNFFRKYSVVTYIL